MTIEKNGEWIPEFIILVGLPYTGKSTYIGKAIDNYILAEGSTVLSSDNIIKVMSNLIGLTYDEGFNKFKKDAIKQFWKDVEKAIQNGDDIIIDRTNMTKKIRKRLIDMIPKNDYHVEAHVFDEISDEEIARRSNKREGQFVPIHVIDNMRKIYQEPMLSEGFDVIKRAI